MCQMVAKMKWRSIQEPCSNWLLFLRGEPGSRNYLCPISTPLGDVWVPFQDVICGGARQRDSILLEPFWGPRICLTVSLTLNLSLSLSFAGVGLRRKAKGNHQCFGGGTKRDQLNNPWKNQFNPKTSDLREKPRALRRKAKLRQHITMFRPRAVAFQRLASHMKGEIPLDHKSGDKPLEHPTNPGMSIVLLGGGGGALFPFYMRHPSCDSHLHAQKSQRVPLQNAHPLRATCAHTPVDASKGGIHWSGTCPPRFQAIHRSNRSECCSHPRQRRRKKHGMERGRSSNGTGKA